MMTGLRLLLMFGIGFTTWGIVFLRSYALDTRRTWLLSGAIFCDEALGIGVGVWLARNGGWAEVVAVAAGGTLAAVAVMRLWGKR